MSLYICPDCPRGCGGHVGIVLRIIEPPFEGMDKLGVNDLQCDTCHHIFEKNIFHLEWRLSLAKTKKLIRRIADEQKGICTITDLLDRWPVDGGVAVRAFEQLNDETESKKAVKAKGAK